MTAIRDPYPTDLAQIDDAALGFAEPIPDSPLTPEIRVLTRIAVALEQLVLNQLDRPEPVQNAPLAALPPVQAAPYAPPPQPVPAGAPAKPAGVCPVHGMGWDKLVPAGNRRSDGKPYNAFWACPTAGCDQRPPR